MDDVKKYGHHKYLSQIADEDVRFVLSKDKSYGASWRWSGGANAWAMVRRKMDRLMEMLKPLSDSDKQNIKDFADNCEKAGTYVGGSGPSDGMHLTQYHTDPKNMAALLRRAAQAEDVFAALKENPSGRDGTVLAEVRDLRRYLLLLEAGMMDDLGLGMGVKSSFTIDQMTLNSTPSVSVPAEDSNRHAEREVSQDSCDEFVPPVTGILCARCGYLKHQHPEEMPL